MGKDRKHAARRRGARAVSALTGAIMVLAGLLGGCSPRAAQEGSFGRARVELSLAAAVAPALSKVKVTVLPGDGPFFVPMETYLAFSGGSWAGFLSSIPAGPGRIFDVVALDPGGTAVFVGTAKATIEAGVVTQLVVALQEPPGKPVVNSVPIVDGFFSSAAQVGSGGSIDLGVVAHDPDAGDSLTYLWTASGGTFDAPTASSTRWVAPVLAGPAARFDLFISVSDGRGAAVKYGLKIVVVGGRAVSGFRQVTYWPDPPSAMLTTPAPDLATAPPPRIVDLVSGAWAERRGGAFLSDGTFASGIFGPDGSFLIPDVAIGSHTLCFDPPSGPHTCTDTSLAYIDLGYDVPGRPDQALATRATPVTLSFAGLDPWVPAVDRIQIASSGANLRDVIGPLGPFSAGDVAGAVVRDWAQATGGSSALHLLVPADVLFVHQLTSRSISVGAGVASYLAISRAAGLPSASGTITGVALQDGQASTITVNLSPVALTGQIDLAWDPSGFEAQLPALAPAGRVTSAMGAHTLLVCSGATPLDRPGPILAGGFPEMMRLDLPGGTPPVLATLSYGRFLPSNWLEWRSARLAVGVSYLAPGATVPLIEESIVERREPVSSGPASLQPLVTPPRNPTLNGQDAFADQTAVGLMPTFAWVAPALGAPTAYVVEVYRLAAVTGSSEGTLVLRYSTGSTSVTIPPGILEPNATYFARIAARLGVVAYDAAPLRTSIVESQATALTGTFVP